MESAIRRNSAAGRPTTTIVTVAELRSTVQHGKKKLQYILCSSITRVMMSEGKKLYSLFAVTSLLL